jgi:regulator of cell morphogenesis and NO signaling
MMNTNRTLGELVKEAPAAAKVLHQHGLDFCCGGGQSFEAACAAEGLKPGEVLREIEALESDSETDVRWDRQPLGDLIQHILKTYHEPLKVEVPRLVDLAAKVEAVHADKPDCPTGLSKLLADIQLAVESHLAKEEQILFPLIVAGRGWTAHMPVQVMLHEHEDHGRNLRRIRELTHDFRLPKDACESWKELYRALAELEVELMNHIHLENNILFPRALAE